MPELTEAEIYQTLLGFCETNNLIAYISHRELLDGRKGDPKESREIASKIKLFLDEKMREAQKAEG